MTMIEHNIHIEACGHVNGKHTGVAYNHLISKKKIICLNYNENYIKYLEAGF